MKSIKTAVLMLFAVSVFSTTPAHSREFGDIYRECGIGGMIFQKDTESNRILAIISNVTWDLGTTAILSDASSEGNCTGGSVAAAEFAMQAYPSIERDLAKGEGEYLHTMLNLMGCESNVQAALTDDLRVDMANAMATGDFESADRYGKASTLFNTVSTRINQSYSTTCNAV